MKPAEFLVIGGTGTVGRELLRQLSAREFQVRALVRDVTGAAHLAGRYVDLVEGDLGSEASVAAALQGIRKAYVITPVHASAADWMERFIALCVSAGLSQVVRQSAVSASLNAPAAILKQHGQADQALASSGLNYTLLRPNAFHQNVLAHLPGIIATGMLYMPFGDAAQSMVDVRDIAAAAVNVLTTDGHDEKTYNLTGPEAVSYYAVAKALSSALDRPVTYVPVSAEDSRESMRAAGLDSWQVDAIVELQAYFSMGEHALVTDDLEKLLGRRPTSFSQFATDIAPYI